MKRPLTVWLLMAYFAMAAFEKARALTDASGSGDSVIFHAAGLGSLHTLLALAAFATSAAALLALRSPNPKTIRAGGTAILFSLAYEAAALAVAALNPSAFEAAIAAQMGELGQSEAVTAALELTTSASVLGLGAAVTLIQAGALYWVLRRNRPYFESAGFAGAGSGT